MDLDDYDFRDPGQLIEEVGRAVPFRAGDVYVVLVRHPSTEQQVERIELLDLDAEQDGYDGIEDELRRVVCSWGIPDEWPITRSVMTIVSRHGRTVIGAAELAWSRAWRYTHHGRSCFDGDLVVVTEHGWLDLMTEWGGATPALTPA